MGKKKFDNPLLDPKTVESKEQAQEAERLNSLFPRRIAQLLVPTTATLGAMRSPLAIAEEHGRILRLLFDLQCDGLRESAQKVPKDRYEYVLGLLKYLTSTKAGILLHLRRERLRFTSAKKPIRPRADVPIAMRTLLLFNGAYEEGLGFAHSEILALYYKAGYLGNPEKKFHSSYPHDSIWLHVAPHETWLDIALKDCVPSVINFIVEAGISLEGFPRAHQLTDAIDSTNRLRGLSGGYSKPSDSFFDGLDQRILALQNVDEGDFQSFFDIMGPGIHEWNRKAVRLEQTRDVHRKIRASQMKKIIASAAGSAPLSTGVQRGFRSHL